MLEIEVLVLVLCTKERIICLREGTEQNRGSESEVGFRMDDSLQSLKLHIHTVNSFSAIGYI